MLRDSIFSHFTKVTHEVGALSTRTQALKYATWGTMITLTSILVTSILAVVMKNQEKLEQKWVVNLKKICDYDEEKSLADFS